MFIFEKIINLQGTTINLTRAVVIGRIVTGGLGQDRTGMREKERK